MLERTEQSGGKGGGGTYMQPTWNSWPQGSFMTLLTPSTYSSRHTTHSLQPLQRLWNAFPAATFVGGDAVFLLSGGDGAGLLVPVVSPCANLDEERPGLGGVDKVDWYVLTGSRSTKLLGALQRRRRMRERMRRRA